MADFTKYLKRIYLELLAFMVIGLLLIYALGLGTYAFGWIWGSIANILYVSMLTINLKKASTMAPKEGTSFMKRTVLVRFSIIIFALLVAVLIPQFNILATGVALLGVKVMVNVDCLLFRRAFS